MRTRTRSRSGRPRLRRDRTSSLQGVEGSVEVGRKLVRSLARVQRPEAVCEESVGEQNPARRDRAVVLEAPGNLEQLARLRPNCRTIDRRRVRQVPSVSVPDDPADRSREVQPVASYDELADTPSQAWGHPSGVDELLVGSSALGAQPATSLETSERRDGGRERRETADPARPENSLVSGFGHTATVRPAASRRS